eukprot:scaffold11522_cov24-Tisochrysis_lutea.AAC.2
MTKVSGMMARFQFLDHHLPFRLGEKDWMQHQRGSKEVQERLKSPSAVLIVSLLDPLHPTLSTCTLPGGQTYDTRS